MPLKRGTSKESTSDNIREFHEGETYRKTKRKHGKKTADRQAVAVVMEQKRRSRRRG